ncbi:MAG TPA: Pycsar system effector family protein [Flavobacteriaceae bacterium]|nr:Pycsar system effector family protein [Flavobacteriaceae bacterium]
MDNLLAEVEIFVSNLLANKLSHVYVYHNLGHTRRVVKSVNEIIEGENITGIDAENLILAAWFHDTGFVDGCENHEEKSVEIAKSFFLEKGLDEKRIENISNLILATKMDYEPKTLLEKVICDSDYGHFKDKEFIQISELLRNEWKLTDNKSFTDVEWTEENISFLTKKHNFHTNFALNNWQTGKDINLASLFKSLNKQKQAEIKEKAKKEGLALKKKKAKIPERGIETMFRVTLRNHIDLSDIADTKANILLSVNAIILSLVLSNLISKLDNNAYLIWPTIIFVTFTVVSMILSVLATRPNVTSGQFTKEDVENKKVNLLFFGNFHKMKLDDFQWAMNELMKDKDYLYNSLIKDLYFLGKVLDRKYKILRITYTIFIIGILVSVSAFAIAFQYIDN